ncbi:MAG: hypothetical protein IJL24_02625 [Treponema sp.]|jgi:protein arginine kinase|nr:hypothetical protein [Treponema sp.]
MIEERRTVGDAWYAAPGDDDDVVLSTRVRLARNLANFPFPESCDDDEAVRIQNIIFDAFNHFENGSAYQSVPLSVVEPLGAKILSERGLFENNFGTGLVMRLDGIASCLVNCVDHARISSFSPGLALNAAYSASREVDMQLQDRVQFAASYDFGYLTANALDSGSGMKASVKIHLPSMSCAGKISDLIKSAEKKGFSVTACYGSGIQAGSSLGAFYQLSTTQSVSGNEIDQLAALISFAKNICESERKFRLNYADNKSTAVRDAILRAFATARFCVLMGLRESIEIVSNVKWGLDLGFIKGARDFELSSLLYRAQSGHLGFLLKTGNFKFEKDVAENDELKEERLRAIIMQDAFKNLSFEI